MDENLENEKVEEKAELTNYRRITGFPYQPGHTVEISKDKLYGLAYYNHTIRDYHYHIGSFPYIFGACRAYMEKSEDDNVDFICFFFELDDFLLNPNRIIPPKPISIINRAVLTPELNAELGDSFSNTGKLMGSIRADLSTGPGSLPDSLAPLSFEDF